MGATGAARDFRAQHAMTGIIDFGDGGGVQWCIETWPAATGIKFCAGSEQGLAATTTAVNSGIVTIPVLAGEGSFRALLAGDLKLQFGKFRSPFVVGLNHFGIMA
jgi:hypothetical protein